MFTFNTLEVMISTVWNHIIYRMTRAHYPTIYFIFCTIIGINNELRTIYRSFTFYSPVWPDAEIKHFVDFHINILGDH